MTLVLNKEAFSQLCRILHVSRNKFAARVSLIGRRAGKRIVIESARRTEKQAAASTSVTRVAGEMLFHPDGRYLLTPLEKQHISDMLLEKNEMAVV